MTSRKSTDRSALVTGGAIRVGKVISLALANLGFDIILHYHSSRADADSTKTTIEALGRECVLVEADLSTPAGIDDVGRVVDERGDRLDVLVNSAAILSHEPYLDTDASKWDSAFALNARAPHLLTRRVAPLLINADGCVVNILDRGAKTPWAEYGVHSATKAALLQLTRLQAVALAPRARANGLLLGDVFPNKPSAQRSAWVGEKALLGHAVSESDIAQAIAFMVGAKSLTGSIITLDAGASLNG